MAEPRDSASRSANSTNRPGLLARLGFKPKKASLELGRGQRRGGHGSAGEPGALRAKFNEFVELLGIGVVVVGALFLLSWLAGAVTGRTYYVIPGIGALVFGGRLLVALWGVLMDIAWLLAKSGSDKR